MHQSEPGSALSRPVVWVGMACWRLLCGGTVGMRARSQAMQNRVRYAIRRAHRFERMPDLANYSGREVRKVCEIMSCME